MRPHALHARQHQGQRGRGARACITRAMGGTGASAPQGAWRPNTSSQNCSASTWLLSVKQRSEVNRYGAPDADATKVPAREPRPQRAAEPGSCGRSRAAGASCYVRHLRCMGVPMC